jgi:hypothetical protein
MDGKASLNIMVCSPRAFVINVRKIESHNTEFPN